MANRNTDTYFSDIPQASISRSRFDLSHSLKTSFNVGDLIVTDLLEVLPGDTFEIQTSSLVRLSTPVTPFMNSIMLDTYWFFVPNRLVWDHWKELNGENNASAWIPSVEYTVPQVAAPSGGWTEGTLADYFGIPTKVDGIKVNALPFRAYALIVNDWFRDQNLQTPAYLSLGDAEVTGSNGSNYVSDLYKGGKPFIASKMHDRFTSCLPAPQKGPDVLLPLGSSAPVYTGPNNPDPVTTGMLRLKKQDGTDFTSDINLVAGGYSSHPKYLNMGGVDDVITPGTAVGVYPSNLYADLSLATASSINQIRLAFQIQRLYERDARGGSRYIEVLQSHFGVVSPDARQQRAEYLGGSRFPLAVQQVVQTSSNATSQPTGRTAAYSLTSDYNHDFIKSFTEHGYLIGLAVARYRHDYQQGLDPTWSRTDRFSYYWPVLANIGEQAVYNREIYCDGSANDAKVFGYNEAWSDYRFKTNKVTGQMRSNATGTLDIWHLADSYASKPSLSSSWIQEDKSNVDRVLNVSSSVSNQLIGDFYFNVKATRPMPLYSVPGLLDHY